jgi:lysyl-tRNA synthetase, class II
MSLPHRFPDRDEIASVRAEAEGLEPQVTGEEHALAGRVMGRRDLGKLVFLDLVDRTGQIQLLCQPGELGDFDVDLGDVVGVRGHATKTKRGEPSLSVSEFQLLAKIKRPLPDIFHGLVDPETRYRRRYLDLLVNDDTRRAFLLRSRVVADTRPELYA